MLRIYRPTSPMSFGSYVLTAFGAATAIGALSELVGTSGAFGRALRVVADISDVPGAVSGALLSTYTASLLASTSTPLWAAASSPMGGHFGASAISSGAAALSLWSRMTGDEQSAAGLDRIVVLAAAADAVFSRMGDSRIHAHGVRGSVDGSEEPFPTGKAAFALGCVLPVASYLLARLTGRSSPGLSVAASVGAILGAAISKTSVVEAGMASADRPRDYFRLTRDGVTARIGDRRLAAELADE
jgi:hypothetical protein